MKTWDTQHSHERYLRCLLNEAHRYQAAQSATRTPATTSQGKHFVDRINELANEVTELMGAEDDDKYVECLGNVSRYHLFAATAETPKS